VEFLQRASQVEDRQLASTLSPYLDKWPFPKSDLFQWVPLVDRFDEVLAKVVEECWDSQSGLQFKPLDEWRDVVVSILTFTRLLLDNCSSRNIYCSYDVPL